MRRGRNWTPPVYPRVCGGSDGDDCASDLRRGLSPRVRGKRLSPAYLSAWRRSIPACAGEANPPSSFSSPRRVYPRVCGGSKGELPEVILQHGLSPRVRGKRCALRPSPAGARSIPACAGEAKLVNQMCKIAQVYPRVCGGSEWQPRSPERVRGLSPRVRGKHYIPRGVSFLRRSIPACAGEAWTRAHQPGAPGVYPRVCGGSFFRQRDGDVAGGLSPRVRGKHARAPVADTGSGSIPACAGEASSARGR